MNEMKNISEIAKKYNLENDIELYGNYKAKINNYSVKSDNKGKLILVTSINPTPEGEGKTTLSIGLNDAFNKLNYNSIVCLREPSLGPVFGTKGGACGGGLAKVVPDEDINLHFNGDFHAITSANNLLSAIIDDHIFKGNKLNIERVTFHRCLDVCDRELRNVQLKNRKESFVITPASEIMAILCLAKDFNDLKEKISNIIIGYDKNNHEVLVRDLECTDAILLLLKDAVKPNLVQTLYNNPAIIHGGPFANIAHGCNSIIATNYGLNKFDYVITEAGFGSDMGALKFFDIKCRLNDIYPDYVIVNATIKALKYHGEGNLEIGIENLVHHIKLMQNFADNVIVSLNKFNDDTLDDIHFVKDYVENLGVKFTVSSMFLDGEDGCTELVNTIINTEINKKHYECYSLDDNLKEKIEKMCKLFGAKDVVYSDKAKEKIDHVEKSHYKNLPICIAKTPFSITDDKDKLGCPKDFTMTVTDILVQGGAGFIVIYMGNVMTMPGFGTDPKYMHIKL